MGFSDLIFLTLKLVFYTVIALVVIGLIPGLPPNVDLPVVKFEQSRKLEGPLAKNGKLDKAELILEKEVHGVESIAADGDTIYFATTPGIVYKYDGKLQEIARTGEPCGPLDRWRCGFPLGIRLTKDGNLFMADGFKGILKINVKTGKVDTIIKGGQLIDGQPVNFADDLDIGPNDTLYWSDAAVNPPEEIFTEFLSMVSSGRVLKTDLKSGKTEVLIKNIAFANGVQLSPNMDFLLVCESGKHQSVLRYYLEGPNKGKQDVFVDRLPGIPDNLRANGKGGYYISLILPSDPMREMLGGYPFVRRILLRVHHALVRSVRFLEQYLPNNYYLGKVYSALIDLAYLLNDYRGTAMIVETDGNGNIVGSLQAESSDIQLITQATPGDKYLYMGSVKGAGIYRLKKNDL